MNESNCPGNKSSQMEDKKVLYLTYMGVLKLLFSSRGDKAKRFQKWATRILFTIQMGDNNVRDEVAAEALNVTE